VDLERREYSFTAKQRRLLAATLTLTLLSVGCGWGTNEPREPPPPRTGSLDPTAGANPAPSSTPNPTPSDPQPSPPIASPTPDPAGWNPMPSGALRWSAALPAYPTSVGGDSSGNVFVTMLVYPPDGGDPVTQLWRFDATGRKEWSIDIGPGWWDARGRMAVTPSGEVALGVCSKLFCYSEDPSELDSAVMRFTSAGTVAWMTHLPGLPKTVEVDAGGRTVVALSSANVGSGLGDRLVLLGERGEFLLNQLTLLRQAW
jgi:hypothetical protein